MLAKSAGGEGQRGLSVSQKVEQRTLWSGSSRFSNVVPFSLQKRRTRASRDDCSSRQSSTRTDSSCSLRSSRNVSMQSMDLTDGHAPDEYRLESRVDPEGVLEQLKVKADAVVLPEPARG